MSFAHMDQVLQELLTGLTTNALSEIATHSVEARRGELAEDAVETAVAGALDQLADVEAILPALGGEKLRGFLRSPEAYSAVRQIFASRGARQIDEVEREFYELWRVRTGGDDDDGSRANVNRLFRSLVDLCQKSLDEAITAGVLTAVDARAAQRDADLRGTIENLERTLRMFASSPNLDAAQIDDFAAKYCRQIAAREGTITPPALDSTRQVPIDSLYVPAQLEGSEGNSSSSMHYEHFSKSLFRRVVLGNPGSGKSTLAKKLAADIARGQLTLRNRPSGIVPFLVVLRDFGAQKRDDPCSVVDFIASTSNSRYQLTPPSAAIEYLLLTNRAIVIFDGLDELLDTSYRAEISGDVESFAHLYSSVPILVTSREVGYKQAPLSPETFDTFRLGAFTNQQVRQYAQNWFAIEDKTGVESDTNSKQVDEFMSDSASVSDLRSNALMLGLMCNLYKGSGYIPRNRPDVYEACAELLFDRWDRLRKIGRPIKIDSLLRPAMQHLAAWIYGDNELQSGVTEQALIETTSDFLLNRRFESEDDAKLEASKFIEFCRGRAWVFTDIGTTPAGERLYQFTHRTFLEFFTAGHLVRTNASPEKLYRVLEPHISAGEWDVVAQLAFQLMEANVDGAADLSLSMLSVGAADPLDAATGNRLNFATRCLEFLVPSPGTTKNLVSIAVRLLMQSLAAGAWDEDEDSGGPVETVLALLAANPENREPIREILIDELQRYFQDPKVSTYAAELALNLRMSSRGTGDSDARGFAEDVTTEIVAGSGSRLREIGETDYWIDTDLLMVGGVDPHVCLANHGLDPFLCERPYKLFPGTHRVPFAEIVVSALLWRHPGVLSADTSRKTLAALAGYLTPEELRNVRSDSANGRWLSSFPVRDFEAHQLKSSDLSGDQLYALLMLVLVFFGSGNSDEGVALIRRTSLANDLGPVTASLIAQEVAVSEERLTVLGLSTDQREALHTMANSAGEDPEDRG